MLMSGFTRLLLNIAFLATAVPCVLGQQVQSINWVTWEEVVALEEKEPRKVLVDVYTDWCGWCKKMDKVTFQHPDVVSYVNANYYAVKFNAEDKNEVRLNDKSYRFVRQGTRGYHELAAEITFGKLSFPTIVFLDEEMKVIQPIPGFKDHEMFRMIMTYFGEDFHKTTPWKKYAASYDRR